MTGPGYPINHLPGQSPFVGFAYLFPKDFWYWLAVVIFIFLAISQTWFTDTLVLAYAVLSTVLLLLFRRKIVLKYGITLVALYILGWAIGI